MSNLSAADQPAPTPPRPRARSAAGRIPSRWIMAWWFLPSLSSRKCLPP